MSTTYALIPRYKFIPPKPISESDYINFKQLQTNGIKKFNYLTNHGKEKLLGMFKVYGVVTGGTVVLWIFMWIVSVNLPNSGAAKLYNGGFFESIMGLIILALFYTLHGVWWEVSTCKNFNRKFSHMITKSKSYSDFLNNYHRVYKIN